MTDFAGPTGPAPLGWGKDRYRPPTTKPKERKWPDDFRGFGTNVKPKKQK